VIRDNGIGIEDTIIKKIFDPFFTTKTTGEAAGVGLYLTHEVIQNYRGDISVKSTKDEFCEFTITLPAIKI
jgi:signal transduction histidine kinase